ncbi:MAG: GGDEF domain-containing protein, partial [Kiritimatiellae bacterium]|nr:GGDEF domain-containing protein [Kiritimatiellia bacterium]
DILLTHTRKADTCFRTGGDEFAVVLPDTDKLSAMAVAKNLIRQISGEPFVIENKRVSISGSAGVAAFNKSDPDITDILSRAERKLNKSKREGKNQVSV